MSKSQVTMGGTGSLNVSVDKNGSLDAPQYAKEQLADNKHGRANARQNAVMSGAIPDDSWTVIDDATYEVFHDTTQLFQDLRNAGLVKDLDLMQTLDLWNIRDDSGDAHVDMDLETTVPEIGLEFGLDGSPVPVIHADYSLGFREGGADDSGRTPAQGLDTMKTTVASRIITETIERILLGSPGGGGPGSEITVNRYGDPFQMHGMLDHPETNTASTTADWTVDNTAIRSDLRAMRQVLKNDNNVRPGNTGYWVYMGETYFDELDDADPEGDGNQTIRDRVENLANINRVAELDFLPAKSVLMFRPSSDIVEVGIASDIQTAQWSVNPWRDKWKTFASIVPRVKATTTGQSGIAYWAAP